MFNLRTRRRKVLAASVLTGVLLAAGVATAVPATAVDDDGVGTDMVGGHPASEQYSAMASLQMPHRGDPNFHFCAAILAPSRMWAVTNAHCVTTPAGAVRPAELLHLRIGSPSRVDGGVYVGVTQVLPHASWDWATGPNPVADIAMLKLDTYVQGAQHIEVAPRLGRRSTATRLLGWGVTEPSGQAPDIPIDLQELDTRLVAPPRCAGGFISAGEICVHNPNGTDGPCYGDSGGPALQKVTANRWQVVGGASRGTTERFCGAGPTIYTDHTFYRNWMFEVMRTGAVPAPAPGQEPTPPPYTNATALHWGIPASLL